MGRTLFIRPRSKHQTGLWMDLLSSRVVVIVVVVGGGGGGEARQTDRSTGVLAQHEKVYI
jgi:hypothetical protein